MSTAAQRRAYTGPAVLSFGFRPFFLFGSLWAAIAAPLWVWMHLANPALAIHRDWHVHEMLFGFLAAIVAGFLTTAVPNWTGRMPVIGARLLALVGLWFAGRLAMLFAFVLGPVSAVVDSTFLVVFAAVIWREVATGHNWRNLPVCALVTALAIGNIASHLAPFLGGSYVGERLGLAAIVMLLTLIGGRITPSFTRNWLKARGETRQPAVFGWPDRTALAVTALGVLAWIAVPDTRACGWILMAAGFANLVRLFRWRGWLTRTEPLLWILHAGYAWLGLGLAALGASRLTPAVPQSAAIHALTAGAVGVMTLAVMARASRGHTGRALAADRPTLLIFLTIIAAAVARVAAPFWPTLYAPLLIVAAALWFLAFGGFAAVYSKMLLGPKPALRVAG